MVVIIQPLDKLKHISSNIAFITFQSQRDARSTARTESRRKAGWRSCLTAAAGSRGRSSLLSNKILGFRKYCWTDCASYNQLNVFSVGSTGQRQSSKTLALICLSEGWISVLILEKFTSVSANHFHSLHILIKNSRQEESDQFSFHLDFCSFFPDCLDIDV